jgi:uncharacterized protein (TIGR02265 family)
MGCAHMPTAPADSSVRGSAFEALLVRMLHPSGRFADELRAAGYDPSAPPRPEYPRAVWVACVQLASRHTFPSLSPEAAMRQLGQRFVESYRQTLTGKLVSATLPMMGPATVLLRMPRVWAGIQPGLRLQVTEVAPREWTFAFEERGLLTDFCTGILEGVLAMIRVRSPEVTQSERTPDRCVVRVRWRE